MKANENMIGKRFGKLVVISRSENDKTGKRKWLCKCDCKNEKVIYEQSLCRGATCSCGCYAKEKSRNRMSRGWAKIFTKDYLTKKHIEEKLSLREIAKENGCSLGCIVRYMDKHELVANDSFYDIIGKKFGKLTVLDMSHSSNGRSYWNVECECKVRKIVEGHSLVRCAIVSCGCWNKEKCWQGCGDLSKSYWSRQVAGAIKRNLKFDITIEYAWDLFQKQQGRCVLSNREIVMDRSYGYNSKKTVIQTASIDRIDPRLGYVMGNIQWVHATVNRMKSNIDQDEFINFCKDISLNA